MNYQELRAALNAVVFENTTGEITGEKLNTILQRIISTLGAGARFVGIATPELVPPTPDNIVFYMATTAGEYPGFGEGVSLDGKTLHLFVSGPEEGWVDIPTSISTGVLTAEAIATALGYVPASTAVSFNVQSDEYLTFPASQMSLAVIIKHEDNVLPPIFVTGDNYEQFFVSAVEGWDIPVSFVSGTIEDGRVLAIHNGFDDEEQTLPVVVKVVSLTGDELPEIFVSEEGGFDEEPTPFPVRYLYAKPADGIPASDMASGVQTSLGKADTALQPVSGATNGNLAGLNSQGKVVDSGKKPSDFAAANLVPAQATPSNQLADKNFVNSSIQTETATFRGNYDTWEDVPDTGDAWENAPDNNDYLVVRDASNYAPIWDNDWAGISGYPGFVVGDIVTDYSETLEKYVLCRCIADINYDEDPEESSPANNPTHFEIVTSNPNYEGTWRFKYPDSREYDKYNWLPEYQVNEKPLTAAQLAALNSGITDTKVAKLDALPATIPTEVFWAEYGVTTYQEIVDAVNAGKLVLINYGGTIYVFQTYTSVLAKLYSFSASENLVRQVEVRSSNNSYILSIYNIQFTSNRVSEWQSTPDNTHYPSEKLVYDSLYKRGVISQTQTWTQAADGGYDYSINPNSVVRGGIPIPFIDLWNTACLVNGVTYGTFNGLTGYFELNGITDISYQEAQRIVLAAQERTPHDLRRWFFSSIERTNLPLSWYNPSANPTDAINDTSANFFAYLSKCETICLSPGTAPLQFGNSGALCYLSQYLKKILNPFIFAGSISGIAFTGCYSLEEVRVHSLKADISFANCARLSKDSVLYMINNEAATSAITITLHATAYVRAMADADITAALQNHPNVTLASV